MASEMNICFTALMVLRLHQEAKRFHCIDLEIVVGSRKLKDTPQISDKKKKKEHKHFIVGRIYHSMHVVWQGQYRTAWCLDSCLHTTDVTDGEAWWHSPPYSLVAGAKVRVDCLGWRPCASMLVCAPTCHIHPLRNTFCCLAVTLCKSNPSSITTRSHFLVILTSSLSFSLHPLYSSLRRRVSFHPGSSPIWTSTLRFYYDVCVFFSSIELL